ncbi:MAG: Translation initiation factor IF-2 [uncultured bacterium]|nr:MAG: Translation initiation factor IF-2 [uncultured bacterium]
MKIKRQPIVVVLGHVDHGKTSLLDALRETSVTKSEAGGITQSIGASVVTTKDGSKITFIDTPGHAAFFQMRSRGSKLADIALLVLDSSDGVKPQTKEALEHIQIAKIPCIVVCTKTDLPAASIDVALSELEKLGILFEGRGGQTPYLGVSAKKKEGLTELLDLISLLSDVNNVEGDSEADLEAVVIETTREKGGNMVSCVVRNGKLEIGEEIYTEGAKGKIKGLFDDKNKPIKFVNPGEPARILGFESLPSVGSIVTNRQIDKQSLSLSPKQNTGLRDKTKIPLYLKANNAGSLEALVASIPQEFTIIDASVGDVIESDVMNAKSNKALIFVFESKVSSNVKNLAEMDKVKIERFDVIYQLLERLDEIVKSGLIEIVGKAEIIASFPFDKSKVAGSKIMMGRIEKAGDIRLMRGEIELGKVKIISIKKQKQEVGGVSQGEECGILFVPQLDFQIGDAIIAVRS